jgi:hypothetical protein
MASGFAGVAAVADTPSLLVGGGSDVTVTAPVGQADSPIALASTVEGETQRSAPLRSGKPIYVHVVPDSKGGKPLTMLCTSGFFVETTEGPAVITAGHCGPDGRVTTLGSQTGPTLGDIDENFFWDTGSTSVDAAVIGVSEAATTIEPSIFLADGTVLDVTGAAQVSPGDRVCVRGAATGVEVCGTIEGGDESATYESTSEMFPVPQEIEGMLTVAMDDGLGITLGDSGGPVYLRHDDGSAAAVGIVSGSIGPHKVFVTPITSVLDAVEGTLVTSGTEIVPSPVAEPAPVVATPMAPVAPTSPQPGEPIASAPVATPTLPATTIPTPAPSPSVSPSSPASPSSPVESLRPSISSTTPAAPAQTETSTPAPAPIAPAPVEPAPSETIPVEPAPVEPDPAAPSPAAPTLDPVYAGTRVATGKAPAYSTVEVTATGRTASTTCHTTADGDGVFRCFFDWWVWPTDELTATATASGRVSERVVEEVIDITPEVHFASLEQVSFSVPAGWWYQATELETGRSLCVGISPDGSVECALTGIGSGDTVEMTTWTAASIDAGVATVSFG